MNKQDYKRIERKLKKLQKICENIEKGITVTTACEKEKISFAIFQDSLKIIDGNIQEGDWADKFISEVCNTPCKAPNSFDTDVKIILGDPNWIEKIGNSILQKNITKETIYEILKSYYKDANPYETIAVKIGITTEQTKLIIDEILQVMRDPWNRYCLRHGLASMPRTFKTFCAQDEYDRKYRDRQNNMKEVIYNKTLKISEEIDILEDKIDAFKMGADEATQKSKLKRISIKNLNLPIRVENALLQIMYSNHDIFYEANIYDLSLLTKKELLYKKGLSEASYNIIAKEMLSRFAIDLNKN